jgi:hypothetical protein
MKRVVLKQPLRANEWCAEINFRINYLHIEEDCTCSLFFLRLINKLVNLSLIIYLLGLKKK